MKKIRVIGDIHGVVEPYLNTIWNTQASLQLGDFGFDYRFLDKVYFEDHKFFPGNHDNYDKCFAYPHCLGDYGSETLNGVEFYFIRGGFSIDKAWRIKNYQMTGQLTYWEKEELNLQEMFQCFEHYQRVKPDFVITHECPRSVSNLIGNPEILRNFGFDPDTFTTRTSELLDACFKFHQPKLWIFGHYHKRWTKEIDGTKFICLPEFGYCDVDVNLNVTKLYTN